MRYIYIEREREGEIEGRRDRGKESGREIEEMREGRRVRKR